MSPLRDASAAASLEAWLDAVRPAGGLQPPGQETVPLGEALGRVTAAPVVARRSSPAFDAAAMDGIAVSAAATAGAPVALPEGSFHRVDTGDPLPPEADAVVRREDVVLADAAELEHAVLPYANVRQVAEDVAAGDLLFHAGRCLRPPDLAVLASVGETSVTVRRRPAVVIVPTGDELVPLGTEPGPGQIVDTNSLMLAAMVEEAGGLPARLPIVPDDPRLLAEAVVRAAVDADLVLLLAGSARGAADHAVAAIERVGQVLVHGVAVKPGHPVVLGLAGSTPLIGVPGYPISAALAFELFATPVLAELGGRPAAGRPRARATAAVTMRSSPGSEEWMRLRLARVGPRLVALPLRRGAGVLSSLSRADGLTCVPLGSAAVAEGDEVEVELLRPLEAIERSLLVSGSTDPLLDRLAARCELSADPDGSANGAAALAAGRCHLALVVTDDLPAGAIVLGTWERQIGLAVAPGDPLGIGGADGLGRPGLRIANRQQGSSSRGVLDALLAERSIDPATVTGYSREARSHAAAVAAVAVGVADCAVASAAACSGQPVELIPLSTQTLVLAAAGTIGGDARLAGLREALDEAAIASTEDGRRYS